MKRALSIGLLTASGIGFGAWNVSAAPIAPPPAPAEATSTAEQVQRHRHYRERRYSRGYRHYSGPRHYYGPRYYGYGPYYRDYYYGGPSVSIGVPFFNLHVGPRHRYYDYW